MLRYYPTSKVLTNQVSSGRELVDSSGKPYTGKYYLTYDGKVYSGPSPQVGPSEPLQRVKDYANSPILGALNLNEEQKLSLANKTGVSVNRIPGKPNSFYPQPIESDYKKGYIIRYFTKKKNDTFIIEISEQEYNSIVNGSADYDVKIYQVTKILWKITGPLNSQRKSQYNIIPGIVETNKRLTEESNKTFLGIVEYIGEDYAKYARPTA